VIELPEYNTPVEFAFEEIEPFVFTVLPVPLLKTFTVALPELPFVSVNMIVAGMVP
jgi:hypothetical protein